MARSIVARRKPQVPAEDTVAFGQIAERFRRAGDLDRAVSLCRDGLQKFPDHISARATLGWSLLELGKYTEARTELETVLRRAPDNLSAIRGLAELHDRVEHTMDLPMDGPGQWPPDPETLEQLDRDVALTADSSVGAGDIVDEAVWARVRGVNEHDELDAAGRPEPLGPAFLAPPELGLAMWSAVAPSEAEVAPKPVPASGMSSVRELDLNAGFVTFSSAEHHATFDPVPSPPIAAANGVEVPYPQVDPAAAEVDLAALIAEANSLDAAADVDAHDSVESMEPALLLDAAVDLSAFEEVGLVVPGELTAGYDAPAPAAASIEPAIEHELLAPPAEVLTAFEQAPSPESTPELEPVFELTPWDETAVSDTLAAEEAALAFEGAVLLAAPPETAQALDFESVPAPIAIAVPVVPVVEVRPFVKVAGPIGGRSPVASLERFLGNVQARRRQLVAESVA